MIDELFSLKAMKMRLLQASQLNQNPKNDRESILNKAQNQTQES
jgi:hypothetical protein